MKKLLNNRISHLLFLGMILIVTMLISCNNDDEASNGAPVITEVRNYAAAPNDTLVNKLVPGQWVVLKGSNLKNAVKIAFNGIAVEFNGGLFSDTYAVVQIPSVIPFPSIPENQLNTIEVVNANGSTIFNIDIVAGPPVITGILNENPVENDSVTVYGTNLFLIEEIVFAGVPITDYKDSNDGTSIAFLMPNVTTGGPLSITTLSGTFSTTFNVNDVTTNSLCNFDNVNTFAWGTGTSNSSVDFSGNHGSFAVLDCGILNAGDGSWWNWGRSINTNVVQWVPVADLAAGLVTDYALKFEMNVPGEWNGITLRFSKEGSDFSAKFEPWKSGAYTTNGKWLTVTIPFSQFKKDDKQATSLTQLLGAEGKGEIRFQAVTGSNASVTGLKAAIDNIRVVKISQSVN